MKLNGNPVWLLVVCLLAMLTSCDPMSSVEYRVRNMTADTVTVDMYKEIMTSDYRGYYIEQGDSVVQRFVPEDSIYLATVPPGQCLVVNDDWSGLYREEWIVPLWKYVKSIHVGNNQLDSLWWSNEQSWHLKTEGGGFGEGESRYYDLIIRG